MIICLQIPINNNFIIFYKIILEVV